MEFIFKKKFLFVFIFFTQHLFSQIENVEVGHRVYDFLSLMSVSGKIENYNDAILPLSKREISNYLLSIKNNEQKLSQSEREIFEKYFFEFVFEGNKNFSHSYSIFSNSKLNLSDDFTNSKKHLYIYSDSPFNFFIDGNLNFDFRFDDKKQNSKYVEFGGKILGSFENVAFSMKGTNAEFFGDRNILKSDKRLRSNYKIYDEDFNNFDFSEGYLKIFYSPIDFEIGRERILFGKSFGEKIFISDNAPQFDFIKTSIDYKFFHHDFIHGWILSHKGKYDTIKISNEKILQIEDKFFATHRFQFDFSNISIGFNELVIYSNRSIDAAYLNPFNFFESVQRAKKDRDNTFIAFDLQVFPIDNLKFNSTVLFDDINFKTLGTKRWDNRFAIQSGILYSPLFLKNTVLKFEYTRVEPYVFSHGRSENNNYTHDGYLIGTSLKPNSENMFFGCDLFLSQNIFTSLNFKITNHGKNVIGNDTINFGGNEFLPHRQNDNNYVKFLDGDFKKQYELNFYLEYEFMRDFSFEIYYQKFFGDLEKKNLFIITSKFDF